MENFYKINDVAKDKIRKNAKDIKNLLNDLRHALIEGEKISEYLDDISRRANLEAKKNTTALSEKEKRELDQLNSKKYPDIIQGVKKE